MKTFGDALNKKRPTFVWLIISATIVAICILSHTYFERKRQRALQDAIKKMCLGMTSLETRQILNGNGVEIFPFHGEQEIETAFRDSTFSLFDYFNPDKKITYFRISEKSGLWLIYTQKYKFFIDDDFPRVIYDLENCSE
jgi:hypothetical protein